jgi:hypothetical protein
MQPAEIPAEQQRVIDRRLKNADRHRDLGELERIENMWLRNHGVTSAQIIDCWTIRDWIFGEIKPIRDGLRLEQ